MKRMIPGSAVALLIGAAVWTHGGPIGAGSDDRFRVTVDEVIHEDSINVTRIGIETRSESTVRVVSDKSNRGGLSIAARPGVESRTRLMIFGDHVRWEAGSTDALKFMMKAQGGSGSVTTSETGPMPAGKRLADVLTVLIKTGEYSYGGSTKLVTFKDVTYSLIVERVNKDSP